MVKMFWICFFVDLFRISIFGFRNFLHDQHLKHRLLCMKPVFRLVEDNRPGAVDHLSGNFFTPVGGQAVHHERIGTRDIHELRIYLETGECFQPGPE